MLAVHCPSVPTRTGLTLVPERRIVRLTDDGAGTITLVVACWAGHLHEVVTGRATTDPDATPLRRSAPEPVPAAAAC